MGSGLPRTMTAPRIGDGRSDRASAWLPALCDTRSSPRSRAKLGKVLGQENLSVGVAPPLPNVGQMSLEWYDECGGRRAVPISTRRQTTTLAIPYLRDRRRHGETRPRHMAVRTPESHWGQRCENTPLIVALGPAPILLPRMPLLRAVTGFSSSLRRRNGGPGRIPLSHGRKRPRRSRTGAQRQSS